MWKRIISKILTCDSFVFHFTLHTGMCVPPLYMPLLERHSVWMKEYIETKGHCYFNGHTMKLAYLPYVLNNVPINRFFLFILQLVSVLGLNLEKWNDLCFQTHTRKEIVSLMSRRMLRSIDLHLEHMFILTHRGFFFIILSHQSVRELCLF